MERNSQGKKMCFTYIHHLYYLIIAVLQASLKRSGLKLYILITPQLVWDRT